MNRIRQWQSGSLLVAALVVAAGSVYAFGVGRRSERLIGSDASAPAEHAAASDD
ncbi:hypothetical protein G7075_07325 [Phycicoccus sp. HDW14]|uniref:hypothetical protein n=1 Tax=Phycicoccus sp. HDW14 TaxID=2714941 RepID=UPI00140C20F4|nr:hypothetical protein [Phycicoccus sp. HDW14]QIM20985.1 hypothetical protein G7075_07325 [Phycicoccus sp. HDW14]